MNTYTGVHDYREDAPEQCPYCGKPCHVTGVMAGTVYANGGSESYLTLMNRWQCAGGHVGPTLMA